MGSHWEIPPPILFCFIWWWGAGVVICLERGADLHMAQLMPLPLTVSCFSKIKIGFTFLVPAHPGSPGKRAVKRVCVCVYLVKMGRNGGFRTFRASSCLLARLRNTMHKNLQGICFPVILMVWYGKCRFI